MRLRAIRLVRCVVLLAVGDYGRKPATRALQNAQHRSVPRCPRVCGCGVSHHCRASALGSPARSLGLIPQNGRIVRFRELIMIIRSMCARMVRRGTGLPMRMGCIAMVFQGVRGIWMSICILPTGVHKKGWSLSIHKSGISRGFWRLILSIRTSRLRRLRIILISIWRWICQSRMWGIGRGFLTVLCGVARVLGLCLDRRLEKNAAGSTVCRTYRSPDRASG